MIEFMMVDFSYVFVIKVRLILFCVINFFIFIIFGVRDIVFEIMILGI